MVYSETKCVCCNQPLTIQQAVNGPVCDDLSCKGPHLQMLQQSARAKEKGLRQAKAHEALAIIDRTLDPDLPITVVPSIESTAAPLSEERREKFKEHLRSRITLARHLLNDAIKRPELERAAGEPTTDFSSLLVVNACTTCGGYCCQNGKDHAFLSAEDIALQMIRDPDLNDEQLFEQYIDRLPQEIHTNSCVFHARNGCALEREIRSDTCNGFICDGINDHRKLASENRHLECLSVSVDRDQIVRIGYIDKGGERVEFPVADNA